MFSTLVIFLSTMVDGVYSSSFFFLFMMNKTESIDLGNNLRMLELNLYSCHCEEYSLKHNNNHKKNVKAIFLETGKVYKTL